jgi:hypothetical protein
VLVTRLRVHPVDHPIFSSVCPTYGVLTHGYLTAGDKLVTHRNPGIIPLTHRITFGDFFAALRTFGRMMSVASGLANENPWDAAGRTCAPVLRA